MIQRDEVQSIAVLAAERARDAAQDRGRLREDAVSAGIYIPYFTTFAVMLHDGTGQHSEFTI